MDYPTESLTARPWKMVVGRRSFPIGKVFSVVMLNFRGGIRKLWSSHPVENFRNQKLRFCGAYVSCFLHLSLSPAPSIHVPVLGRREPWSRLPNNMYKMVLVGWIMSFSLITNIRGCNSRDFLQKSFQLPKVASFCGSIKTRESLTWMGKLTCFK